MTQSIRAAELPDAKALSYIAGATFALACAAGTPHDDISSYIAAELTASRFEDHIRCPSKSIFVAEINSVVCGYIMLCREEAPEHLDASHPLELRRIYVLPEQQGTGLAQDLLERAVHEATVGGHDSLWLGVSGSNRRGIGFYAKHEFVIAGPYHFPLGNVVYEGLLLSRSMSPNNSFKPKPLRGSA